jgi:hypothetical protein
MKGKTFLILLVAAGVLGTLTFLYLKDDTHTGNVKMGDKLFADLPVNQVATIVIADPEATVTLIKGEEKWQVQERSGYAADFGKIRDTVVKISRLKIGRRFTGSPDSLTRLALLAPSANDEAGRGKQITLKDSAGAILADFILGQTRETEGGGSGGQYLKKVDGDAVFLVDGNFRFLKSDPPDWLQKEILDIKAEDVAEVTCYTADAQQPVYTLSRPKKGEAAQLTPLPSGRSVDQAKVDQVFNALNPLTVNDVAAGEGKPPAGESGSMRLSYRLYDGRRITIFPASAGEADHSLRVAAENVAEEAAARNPEEDKAASKKDDQAGGEKEKAPVVRTAAQLNAALGPWVFSVQKWQFDSFITRPDDLLEVVDKKGGDAS